MGTEENIVSIVESLLPLARADRRRLGKSQRVGVILDVVEQGPPCASAEEMVAHLNLVFRVVEDRCTDAKFLEDSSNFKERMYGPSPTQQKKNSKYQGALEFWATAHTIWCGHNGSLRIETRGAPPFVTTIIDKAGSDDRRVTDL